MPAGRQVEVHGRLGMSAHEGSYSEGGHVATHEEPEQLFREYETHVFSACDADDAMGHARVEQRAVAPRAAEVTPGAVYRDDSLGDDDELEVIVPVHLLESEPRGHAHSILHVQNEDWKRALLIRIRRMHRRRSIVF